VTNLTLTVDGDVLRRARLRAMQQGTSVNAVVRDFLASFAGESDAQRGLQEFAASARASRAGSGPGGRTWTRDELYAERLKG
jgi:hypothetical protein